MIGEQPLLLTPAPGAEPVPGAARHERQLRLFGAAGQQILRARHVAVIGAGSLIGRRTDVVGIFPDDNSLIRLVSMLAIEANDEWLVTRSYISLQSMRALYEQPLAKATEREEVLELQAA